MSTLLFSIFNNPNLEKISKQLNVDIAKATIRNFPDKESYIKFDTDLKNKDLIIVDSLYAPNDKFLLLLLVANTARDLGAKKIGLCTPYLPYMRQDKRFNDGEGITSVYFSKIISENFDWLVTVDPHLHRYNSLDEIYSIPNSVSHATPKIVEYIKDNIKNPLIIGPDIESKQWVEGIANELNAPYLTLEKIRLGDNNVKIKLPKIEEYKECIPVILDDIISTAQTMIETIKLLKSSKFNNAVCIGIHAIFAGDAYKNLLDSGVNSIITCNTITHASNKIDLSEILCKGIKKYIIN